jgi:hypothetical protein
MPFSAATRLACSFFSSAILSGLCSYMKSVIARIWQVYERCVSNTVCLTIYIAQTMPIVVSRWPIDDVGQPRRRV